MDAVLLACCSAFLFGAMTVSLRIALVRGGGAETGALLTIVPAFATRCRSSPRAAISTSAACGLPDQIPDEIPRGARTREARALSLER